MPYSIDYANMFLNFTFAKIEKIEAPETVYIGLSENDPEEDKGLFNELSGGGYHRVLIGRRGDDYPDYFGLASGRSIINARQINWTKATAPWIEAKGFGLFKTEKGGSPFYYAGLDTPYPVCDEGAVALFDPQTLKLTFSDKDIEESSTT